MSLERQTESRRYDRVRLSAPAAVLSPGDADAVLRTRMEELGMGGCRLQCGVSLGVGRVVSLFLATEPEPVRAIAKVLYESKNPQGGYVAGMEFVCLGVEEFFRLRELLEAQVRAEAVA